MATPKPDIYRGRYHVDSRRLVAAAYANPSTICARCGRTLHQHPPTKRTNRPPRWSAGHIDGAEHTGQLRPEILGCNATAANRKRNPRNRSRRTSRTW